MSASDPLVIPTSRRMLFRGLLLGLIVLALCVVYFATVAVRGWVFYQTVNLHEAPTYTLINRHEGQPYRIDTLLGFTLNPDASGAFLVPGGDSVSFHHDANGFRTALENKDALQNSKHPKLLFLGDSYTYGMLLTVEQTFPYRVAQQLHGQSLNAGVPGWGLAQMVLEARRAIPEYKPDYVVVQYSPWLAMRSMDISAPGSQGMLLTPYFVDVEGGGEDGVRVVPPAFAVAADTMAKMTAYQTTNPDWRNKMSFLLSLAAPYFFHYDAHMLLFRLRLLFGLSPEPSQRAAYMVHAAYAEIDRLASQNGAKLIVLALGTNESLVIPEGIFPKGSQLVNAQQALLDALDKPTGENYAKQYFHWQQGRMVDKHPNADADGIIASTLADKIEAMRKP